MEALPDDLDAPWWRPDLAHAHAIERELARELVPGHPLTGRAATCLARRQDNDDVLFAIDAPEFGYAVVHLTWARESTPRWPAFETFATLDAWWASYEHDVAAWAEET